MNTPPWTRPARRSGARLALLLLAVTGALLAAPTAAAASDGSAHDVRPLVDCVRKNPDGTRTAIFGYDNTSTQTITVPAGKENSLRPSRLDHLQPTTFSPGLHRGVFAVEVDRGTDPEWQLGGVTVSAGPRSAECPPSTQMPVEGNGTGAAVALAVAGLTGAVVVRRARRRASAGAPRTTDGRRTRA